MRNKKKGFTLLEVLVVVIIIAVIAVVALPMYKHAILKSRFSTVMPMAKAVADAQEIYYLGNNQYALGKEDLDIAPVEAENTQVSLSPAEEDEEYIYVAAHRTDIPNVRYIMYQKNSPKFAGNIHCEAKNGDNNAQWLCEKALHGTKIEKGSITPGYTTYILVGSPSDGTFLKTCEEEQETEDENCACGKKTRTVTGCNDLTGEWEYSNWSSCPAPLPDETIPCGEGLVGNKTRSASCNGSSYEYGEWNTDNCAPACKDEDLVLEEYCGDGYAKKTRNKTGCDSEGNWTYTDWDESKCCTKPQVLTEKCGDGYEDKIRTVTGCDDAEWTYTDWNDSKCCAEEDKVLTAKCDDGYETKSHTVTGCSNGSWTYTNWDESKCCKENEKVLTAKCDDGYETKSHTITGCSNGSWIYTNWDESTCCTNPQVLTEKCEDGYEDKIRTVTGCSNASWTYSGWYEGNCCTGTPATSSATSPCSDGYEIKTWTVMGCSNGEWLYDWDESRCCNYAQQLQQSCPSGCGQRQRTVTGCSYGTWQYSNWTEPEGCTKKPADPGWIYEEYDGCPEVHAYYGTYKCVNGAWTLRKADKGCQSDAA